MEYEISYWRTSSGFEVDFILGENEVAIEIKSTSEVQSRHLKGLKAFEEEYAAKKLFVVSNDPFPRKVGNIFFLPYRIFLEKLWGGEII